MWSIQEFVQIGVFMPRLLGAQVNRRMIIYLFSRHSLQDFAMLSSDAKLLERANCRLSLGLLCD